MKKTVESSIWRCWEMFWRKILAWEVQETFILSKIVDQIWHINWHEFSELKWLNDFISILKISNHMSLLNCKTDIWYLSYVFTSPTTISCFISHKKNYSHTWKKLWLNPAKSNITLIVSCCTFVVHLNFNTCYLPISIFFLFL